MKRKRKWRRTRNWKTLDEMAAVIIGSVATEREMPPTAALRFLGECIDGYVCAVVFKYGTYREIAAIEADALECDEAAQAFEPRGWLGAAQRARIRAEAARRVVADLDEKGRFKTLKPRRPPQKPKANKKQAA